MSKRRLVITAVLAGSSQSEAARRYGVSQGWISRLLARYRVEGEAVFEPASRRPRGNPNAIPAGTVELIVALRAELAGQGLDAGPDTIAWHLRQRHGLAVSRSSISRHLAKAGLVAPEPRKRPKSSYQRFAAAMPNECWQSDFTHYRLTRPDGRPGPDSEILTWLDDCSRYALDLTAHPRVTGPIVVARFRHTVAQHGAPRSTLTDNGLVFTTRFAGGRRGAATRNGFEAELRRLGVTQKNGRANHPQTQGKAERFQQTLKKWLAAQHPQPATIPELQALLDRFRDQYNHHRPHRSLPHRATPATLYGSLPKAAPDPARRAGHTHDRLREDKIDKSGTVTLRVAGRLHHIGVGRTHARTPVLLLVHDLDVQIINAATGEILRELTIDPTRDYQGHTTPTPPHPAKRE